MSSRLHRGFGPSLPLISGLAVFSAAGTAHANSAGGLAGMVTVFLFAIGVLGLGLSALLAIGAWLTAVRQPTSVAGIFGRGFLGVSAVLCFAIGIFSLAGVFGLFEPESSEVVIGFLGMVVQAFLAFEFVIGATLYGRAHERSGRTFTRVLSLISYGIAGLLLLGALVCGGAAAVDLLSSP